MHLDEFEVYNLAIRLGNVGWDSSLKLRKLHLYRTAEQLISAIDSVGANIAEGYGRYHYKDSNKFYINARGSLYETRFWFSRLLERSLLTKAEYAEISKSIDVLGIKLNNLISYLRSKS